MNLRKNENIQNVETTRGYSYVAPDCDIFETDGENKIVFDIPGVEKDDINIKVEKEVLTVTAECKKEPVEGYGCVNDEFDLSGYTRSFNLNNVVDTTKIEADYKNGTLELTLPKKEEQKTKEIKIKVS